MKLNDFSSLVQLGVSVHLGTALFQLITEFSGSPLSRKIARLAALAKSRDAEQSFEDAEDLLGDLEVRSIQFFNEFRNVVLINAIVAIALFAWLALIALNAEAEMPTPIAVGTIILCIGPASVSLIYLWRAWDRGILAIRERTNALERRLLFPPR